MSSENVQLERIRKLLAKAEARGVTPAEAEALTSKAAELMARYGIDRALLGAAKSDTDQPADRIVVISNPWASVRAHLLCGIGSAMRCQCIMLSSQSTARVHVFGYTSDIERAELLYTSLLIQMQHGLAAASVPGWASSPRAWRRSWMLGYCSAVISRVRAAEKDAVTEADANRPTGGSPSAALVLVSRDQVVADRARAAYPITRKSRVTYSGSGYRDGYAKGRQADIGTTRLSQQPRAAIR